MCLSPKLIFRLVKKRRTYDVYLLLLLILLLHAGVHVSRIKNKNIKNCIIKAAGGRVYRVSYWIQEVCTPPRGRMCNNEYINWTVRMCTMYKKQKQKQK